MVNVEEPQQPVSATRIARDESAAQTSSSPSSLSVDQARERLFQAVSRLVAVAGSRKWDVTDEASEYTAAVESLITAVRAERASQEPS